MLTTKFNTVSRNDRNFQVDTKSNQNYIIQVIEDLFIKSYLMVNMWNIVQKSDEFNELFIMKA